MIDIKLERGKHCFMYNNLKIFDAYPIEKTTPLDPHKLKWGDVSLYEATTIQNICAWHGLAPRVYGIRRIRFLDQFFYAQVVEVIEGENPEPQGENETYNKIKELGKEWGFQSISEKVSHYDVKNNMLLDFNTLSLTDDYEDKWKQQYIKLGNYGSRYYHNVSEWGLKGAPRHNKERVKAMKLDSIDFKGKTVSDLGMAGGFFCRYAHDRGARHITGYDYPNYGSPDPTKGAYILANKDCYWDIDFVEMDLLKDKPQKADIVFCFSMNYHIGVPAWLGEVTGELCVFEDNSKNRDARPQLEKMFSKVEYITETTDHNPKSPKQVYYCYV